MKKHKIALIIAAVVALAAIAGGVTFLIAMTARPGKEPDSPSCELGPDGKCIPITYEEKPIIYLYPEQETTVSVQLGHPENLLVSYPHYQDGWQVLAQPSGDLTDLHTNRSLYALYWEGKNYPAKVHDTGFIVKGTDTAEFLEDKLAILGLSEREANEFIIYWLPKMEQNPYNYIYFATATEIANYMPLTITPQPDTTIRVMMEYKPLDSIIPITEQTLPLTPTRTGFTAVEWGGSVIGG